MRSVYQAANLLAERDTDEVVPAWFQGHNPALGDRSPARPAASRFSSLVQSRVPEELRGRAFAGFDVLWQSGRILSLLGAELLADAVGIRAVYLLGGLLLLAAAAATATATATATARSVPRGA